MNVGKLLDSAKCVAWACRMIFHSCFTSFLISFRNLWNAYRSEFLTETEKTLKYCKFIMKYADHFDKIYSEECGRWMDSYNAYMDYQEKIKEEAERKKEEARKEAERIENLSNAPVQGQDAEHILRHS